MTDEASSSLDPVCSAEKAERSVKGTDEVDLILDHVRGLREVFEAKIRYDEVRERVVESMSEELTQHRQGVFRMQLRPVLLDLVAIYDDISQMIGAADCLPETAQQLEFVRDSVKQTLARNGAEMFSGEGEAVDRALQKVIAVVETPDPDADRRIAARLRPGFRWDDRVLRSEWVNVYRYDGGAQAQRAEPPRKDVLASRPEAIEPVGAPGNSGGEHVDR
jgi:molecular chaperone GrpE (heat shock protein)